MIRPSVLRDHDHGHGHAHPHHHDDHDLPRPSGPPDPAQESLVSALRSSFNVLRFLMIVLVVLYAFSGIFRVEPGQQGLVARFGTLREAPGGGNVFSPGWYIALPDPFDAKVVLTGQVMTLPVTTFMFAHPEAATSKNLSEIVYAKSELQPGTDGAMFTGDRNLSHGRFDVQFTIGNAAAFVRNVGSRPEDAHRLLTRLTETAVVREAAGRTVEEVTRLGLDALKEGVRRRLQKLVDDLETGIAITDVVVYTIEPGAVRDAFLDVSRAEQEKNALESEAGQKAAETLNRAAGPLHREILRSIQEYGAAQLAGADQATLDTLLEQIDAQLIEAERTESGQVSIRLREARSAANAAADELRTQYDEFVNYLKQREARPAITTLGLWARMRESVLSTRANEIFFIPAADTIEILVNRDPQRQVEFEQEQFRARQQGGPR